MTSRTDAPDAARARSGRLVVPGNRWDLAPASSLRPISVIVPYYESPDDLRRLLAGLDRQTITPHEVVVVDDGSSRAPAADVLVDRPDVRVLWQPDLGVRPAAARNLGAAGATGEVLVFLDGDVIPHPTCLQHLAALPSVLPDALVVGRRAHADLDGLSPSETLDLIAEPQRDPDRWLDDMDWLRMAYEHTGDLLQLDVRGWRYVISAVMAMHVSLFRDVGGFDGARAGYGGEDWELAHRAMHAGAVLAHAPDALVVHNGPDLAGREDARSLKNAETSWLLERVTDRTFRPQGLHVGGPRVIAVCDDEGWDDAALLCCVDSLLRALGDVHVHLTGQTARPGWAAMDPRVRLGDPRVGRHPTRPGGALAHVETICHLSSPVLVDTDGASALLARTDPGGVDRVDVQEDGDVLMTVTAARMVARIARAAADAEETAVLWARTGAARAVRAADVGLRPLEGIIDLEAALDRPAAPAGRG